MNACRLTVFAMLLTCAGCGGLSAVQPNGAAANSVVEVAPRLVSELRPDDTGKVRLLIPIAVTNDQEQTRELIYEGTACSCYGLNHQGQQVEKEAKYSVAPGETIQFELESRPAPVPRDYDLKAFFAWEASGEKEAFTRTAQLKILADASVSQLVSLAVDADQLSRPLVQHLEVQRTDRSAELAAVAPELKAIVPYVAIKSAKSARAPEEVGSGIWKQTWDVDLEIIPPADLAADQLPSSLDFVFVKPNGESVIAKSQLLLTLRTPLQYPSTIAMGRVPAGSERVRKLLIRSSTKTSFSLNRNEATDPAVTIACSPDRQPEQWVEIGYTPTQSGAFEAIAVLNTDVRDLPQITIKLTGTAFDLVEQQAALTNAE